MAVKAGCDLECGCTYGIACDYGRLEAALAQGMLTEDDIDRSVKRLLMARFRLGMFDPDNLVAYSQIPMTVVDSAAHQELALEVARQSLVLLKNDGLLPLDRSKVGSIAVVGPDAFAQPCQPTWDATIGQDSFPGCVSKVLARMAASGQ